MTELTEEYKELLKTILWHYLYPPFRRLVEFEEVINNRTQITENGQTFYAYECPCQTIYLSDEEEPYPITYENQEVNPGSDEYFYHFDDSDAGMERIVTYEWKRNSIWED